MNNAASVDLVQVVSPYNLWG